MDYTLKECVVIGSGISGIAMSRWLKQYEIDFLVVEKSNDIGGLWHYREDDFGVMESTHINVSKYNYCYSDHSFGEKVADFPHHTEMLNYIKSYVRKFDLNKHILLNTLLLSIEELEKEHELNRNKPKFKSFKSYERLWKLKIKDLELDEEFVYITPYVTIASGHHATPSYVDFPGLSSFPGSVIHSVKFKGANFNKMCGKRVLIVGIGNSAVDVATNLATEGKCPKITISTRSGAWIIPNYMAGFPVDLYSCRAILALPWWIATRFFEAKIKLIYGDPKQYNLNPTMRAMQTQPTISPTLIHHIQRKHVNIEPNIKSIKGSLVTFENNETHEYDQIILCTGYKMGLEFLSSDLRAKIFNDQDSNLNLFKQVFHPSIGKSMSFIGFVQASSGGVLPVSEMQARWHVQLMTGGAKLPTQSEMNEDIKNEKMTKSNRYHPSKRHNIQIDPITYNDQIASYFNTNPIRGENIGILWRLFFSSCGPAQYRLNGPDADSEAREKVVRVPVTGTMKLFAFVTFLLIAFILFKIIRHPFIAIFILFGYYLYRYFFITSKKH